MSAEIDYHCEYFSTSRKNELVTQVCDLVKMSEEGYLWNN
jgi:hypothetical protein